MENYHENVMINENSEYNGLENISSIENTENIVLETLLLLGLSLSGVALIVVIGYFIYRIRRLRIYKKMEFVEKLGELEHNKSKEENKEEIELKLLKKKDSEVYETDRIEDSGIRGEEGDGEGGEDDERDR